MNQKIKLKRVVLVICGLILAGTLGISYLRLHSPMFNYFFRPKDLYESLAETAFDLDKKGKSYELHFRPHYPGNHAFEFLVTHPVPVGDVYYAEYSLRFQMLDDSGKVLREVIIGPPDGNAGFWGRSGNSGLFLHKFKVPSDFPRGKDIIAKVTVLREDSSFRQKYGSVRLGVKKFSDE
jgi:hypothetical protein